MNVPREIKITREKFYCVTRKRKYLWYMCAGLMGVKLRFHMFLKKNKKSKELHEVGLYSKTWKNTKREVDFTILFSQYSPYIIVCFFSFFLCFFFCCNMCFFFQSQLYVSILSLLKIEFLNFVQFIFYKVILIL